MLSSTKLGLSNDDAHRIASEVSQWKVYVNFSQINLPTLN